MKRGCVLCKNGLMSWKWSGKCRRFNSNSNPQPKSSGGVVSNITAAKRVMIKSTYETVQDLRELVQAMEKKKYKVRRIQIALGILGGMVIYSFYGKIIGWLSDQATTVTTKSMEDPQFLEDAVTFGTEAGKQIIYNLSKDPETKTIFEEFFKDLFTSKTIEGAASNLSKEVIRTLIMDPEYESLREEAQEYVRIQLIAIMLHQKVQHTATYVIWNSVNDAFLPWRWGGPIESKELKEEPRVKEID